METRELLHLSWMRFGALSRSIFVTRSEHLAVTRESRPTLPAAPVLAILRTSSHSTPSIHVTNSAATCRLSQPSLPWLSQRKSDGLMRTIETLTWSQEKSWQSSIHTRLSHQAVEDQSPDLNLQSRVGIPPPPKRRLNKGKWIKSPLFLFWRLGNMRAGVFRTTIKITTLVLHVRGGQASLIL